MRMQDAVPDELEIIPDGEESKHAPGVASPNSPHPGAPIPIPKTVVQKVDPISSSHGEVPGTTARPTHKADAVPDVIVQVDDPEITACSEAPSKRSFPSIPIAGTGAVKLATGSSTREDVGEGADSNISGVDGKVSMEKRSEGHSKFGFCENLSSERLTGVRFTNTFIEQIHIFPRYKSGILG